MRPENDPDAEWVAALSGRVPASVRRAIDEAVSQRRLYASLARRHRAVGRDSYIEIDAPLELHALVRLLRPAHIVEVGVSSGVSSAYLLNALAMNGRGLLHSIDLPSHPTPRQIAQGSDRGSWTLPPGRSTGWAVPPALWPRWDLRLGDKADVLPILRGQIPRIDLMIYDVPHRCEVLADELRAADRLFVPGSVVIIDHGPGGGRCDALATWRWARGREPVGRSGLGLFGARAIPRPRAREGRPWRSGGDRRRVALDRRADRGRIVNRNSRSR